MHTYIYYLTFLSILQSKCQRRLSVQVTDTDVGAHGQAVPHERAVDSDARRHPVW